jgi:GDPmannose 4,6-dehydratase
VARIKLKLADKLPLGNLDARRDWSHAREYVKAMWKMLQQESPDDYVIATGETHSVREFCEKAFGIAGLDYRDHVVRDERLFRPAEVEVLLGDASKAGRTLGWRYGRTFDELIEEMVENDLEIESRRPAELARARRAVAAS